MREMRDSGDFVKSFEKGLKILTLFCAEQPQLTLSEAAELASTTRAAARRSLLTLAELGYVSYDERYFKLTPKTLELGYAYLASLRYYSIVEPYLQEVTDKVQESTSAGVLDNTDVVYVARAPAKRVLTITTSVGTRIPAYTTSMGRVLLANLSTDELDRYFANATLEKHTPHSIYKEAALRKELEKVAKQGYSIIDQELEIGLRTIAIPLSSKLSKAEMGVNIAASASRVDMDTMINEFLPVLQVLKEKAEHTAQLAFI
jgi:IclR family pca regulon transcriptional regulator